MTGKEKHLHRDAIARDNGYRPITIPDDPEWAGRRLPGGVDEQAARAALSLRGLDPHPPGLRRAA